MTAKAAKLNLELTTEQLRLFEKHQRMVNIAAAKYARGEHRESREDIAQIARMALARAIKTFKADRRVPFGAYAWKCIENGCKDFLKRPPQPKRYDDMTGIPDRETKKPMTLFEAVEAHAARRELQARSEDDYDVSVYRVRYAIMNSLEGIERRAVLLRLRGSTLGEIAKRLKTSKTTTQRALQRALAKLRKRLKK